MVQEALRPVDTGDWSTDELIVDPIDTSVPQASWLVVPVIASCGLVAALMQTVMVPLIPSLPRLMHASAANASWVITATLLSAAICTPVAGRLGDMFGKRRVLLFSLSLLVAGAVVSALSTSLWMMIVGRALQGSAMGAIALGISLMKDILPEERRGSAIAFMSSTMGVGGAIGLPVAALVAQNFSWHVLFWGSGAVAALVAVLVATVVPESPLRAPGRVDVLGVIGLAAGLLSLLLAISKGNGWGWTSPLTLGLLAFAAAELPFWGWYQLRRRAPLVDLRTAARRPVLLTNIISVLVGFTMYGSAMILPQLLQGPSGDGIGLGKSMLAAGLCMAPSGVVMLIGSPFSARLTAARGARTTLMVGAGTIAFSFLLGSFLMNDVWEVVLVSTLSGAGVALGYAAMPTLIMQFVPESETAAANGLNALMRSFGTSLASAVMAVVLTDAFVPAAGGLLPSGTGAFRLAFLIAAASGIAGAVLCLTLPRHTGIKD